MNLKVFSLIVLTMSLLGCASTSQQKVAIAEPTVEPFNELLITYTPTAYGMATSYTGKGATGLGGIGGLLGPLGSVAGMLLDQALEAGIASASADRSLKLEQKIKANVSDWDVNRAQAQYIADRIAKETTLNVHIEAAAASSASGVTTAVNKLKDKQVRLELSTVTGYGAGRATDSFKPIIVTKYAVRVGEPERKVIEQELIAVAPQGEATFMTWEGVMSEADKVPAMAARQLQIHSDKIADRLQKAWQKSVEKAQAAADVQLSQLEPVKNESNETAK